MRLVNLCCELLFLSYQALVTLPLHIHSYWWITATCKWLLVSLSSSRMDHIFCMILILYVLELPKLPLHCKI